MVRPPPCISSSSTLWRLFPLSLRYLSPATPCVDDSTESLRCYRVNGPRLRIDDHPMLVRSSLQAHQLVADILHNRSRIAFERMAPTACPGHLMPKHVTALDRHGHFGLQQAMATMRIQIVPGRPARRTTIESIGTKHPSIRAMDRHCKRYFSLAPLVSPEASYAITPL